MGDSDAEKVNDVQKPSVQLKVDNKPKANEKTETKIEKKEAPMKMQGEENEPKKVKKEKEDSDVDIKKMAQQKGKVNEDQKPSEQLKVDSKAKANERTETKIGKTDTDADIQLNVGQKEKVNDDKKPAEQLKVDHKPEEQTEAAAKEKKVKMVKKKKKKAKTDSNDEIKFDELISEPNQVSYTVEEPDTIKDVKAVQSAVEITDVDNQKEEEASVPVDMKSSDNLPIIKELS